jgi:hypothetical protein
MLAPERHELVPGTCMVLRTSVQEPVALLRKKRQRSSHTRAPDLYGERPYLGTEDGHWQQAQVSKGRKVSQLRTRRSGQVRILTAWDAQTVTRVKVPSPPEEHRSATIPIS